MIFMMEIDDKWLISRDEFEVVRIFADYFEVGGVVYELLLAGLKYFHQTKR